MFEKLTFIDSEILVDNWVALKRADLGENLLPINLHDCAFLAAARISKGSTKASSSAQVESMFFFRVLVQSILIGKQFAATFFRTLEFEFVVMCSDMVHAGSS